MGSRYSTIIILNIKTAWNTSYSLDITCDSRTAVRAPDEASAATEPLQSLSRSTRFKTLFLAATSVLPAILTGSTQWSRNNVAIVATNSTCEDFLPGQFFAYPDQARYVPPRGVMSSSPNLNLRTARDRYCEPGGAQHTGDLVHNICRVGELGSAQV